MIQKIGHWNDTTSTQSGRTLDVSAIALGEEENQDRMATKEGGRAGLERLA